MTQVTIEGDRLCADSLCVRDPELVRFVAEHEDADRPALVERALRVGLIALANAGVTVNVDAVQREFAALLERMDRSNEAASEALTMAATGAVKVAIRPERVDVFPYGTDGSNRVPGMVERLVFLGSTTQVSAGSFAGSPPSSSTRSGATARSGGSAPCSAPTSTAMGRSSPNSSTRRARAARSTGFATRCVRGSSASPSG